MNTSPPIDLVLLVPGKDDREAIDGLLSARRESLGIRPLRFQILVHPRRDPGVFHEAPDVLQPFQRRAGHALVLFDHEGSGQESRSPAEVAADLKKRLASGWGERAEILLLQPELEIWVWSDSPAVDAALGWQGRVPSLRDWLSKNHFWPSAHSKPPKPKESLLAALRQVRIQRSSSIYRQIAERVGLERCQDPAFHQFKTLMKSWFPRTAQP